MFTRADNHLKKIQLLLQKNKLTMVIFLKNLYLLKNKASYYYQRENLWTFYNLLPDSIKYEQDIILKILPLFCEDKKMKEIIPILPGSYTHDLQTVLKVIDCLRNSHIFYWSETIYSYYKLLPNELKFNEKIYYHVLGNINIIEKEKVYSILFMKFKTNKAVSLLIFDSFIKSEKKGHSDRAISRRLFYEFPEEVKYDIDYIKIFFKHFKYRNIIENKQWFSTLMKDTKVNKQIALDIFSSRYFDNDDKLKAYNLMTPDLQNDGDLLTKLIINIDIIFLVEKAPFLIKPFIKNENIITNIFKNVYYEDYLNVKTMLKLYTTLPKVTRYNTDIFNIIIDNLKRYYTLVFDVLSLMPINKLDNEFIDKLKEYTKKTITKTVVDKPARYESGTVISHDSVGIETCIVGEILVEPKESHIEITGYEYDNNFVRKLKEAVAELRVGAGVPDTGNGNMNYWR